MSRTLVTSYELRCTECAFRTTVVGEYDTVLDEIGTHQQNVGAGPTEHFVNVRSRD